MEEREQEPPSGASERFGAGAGRGFGAGPDPEGVDPVGEGFGGIPFGEPGTGGAGGGPRGRGGQRARSIEFQCVDFCPICRTADLLRATVPAEFQDHWHAWQRELLLAMRSLLDHYIEHVEAERQRAVQVEDIPIE